MVILAGFTPAVPVVFAAVFVYGGIRRWPKLAAAAVWAVALAAVQLLPTIELVGHTEALRRHQVFGLTGGMLWQGFVSMIVPNAYNARDAHGFALPHNATFHYLFSSLTAVALALYARHARLALFTVLFAVLTLGFNLPGVAALYAWIPGAIRSAVYFEYFSFPFLLGVSMLAAHGAAKLPGRWAGIACGVAVAEMLWLNSGLLYHAMPLKDSPAVTHKSFEGSAETLLRLRMLTGRSPPPQRIEIYDDSMGWAHSAPIMRVFTVSGNDPLVIARYQAVRALYGAARYNQPRYMELDNLDSPLPGMLNVGFVLSWSPGKISHPGWPKETDLPGHVAVRNTRVLPRFYLVPSVKRPGSMEESMRLLGDPEFDPAKSAVVEGEVTPQGGGTVRVVRYGPSVAEIDVDAEAQSFLASSETHYPGWQAKVDGRPVEILMTNGAFRGIPVPAGRHQVVFEFLPNWRLGALISALALTLFVARSMIASYRSSGERRHS